MLNNGSDDNGDCNGTSGIFIFEAGTIALLGGSLLLLTIFISFGSYIPHSINPRKKKTRFKVSSSTIPCRFNLDLIKCSVLESIANGLSFTNKSSNKTIPIDHISYCLAPLIAFLVPKRANGIELLNLTSGGMYSFVSSSCDGPVAGYKFKYSGIYLLLL